MQAGTVIIPPPNLRTIIDKTALFVARNGVEFEHKIAEQKKDSAQFGFLMSANPYHSYYRQMVQQGMEQDEESDEESDEEEEKEEEEEVSREGNEKQEQQTQVIAKKANVFAATTASKREKPEHDPWPYTYGIPLPKGITPLQVDTIKLTAQFAALNGAQFVSALHGRESRNPQFDFMKVTHRYFNFYNSLTNIYRVLIAAGEVYKEQEVQRAKKMLLEKEKQQNGNQEKTMDNGNGDDDKKMVDGEEVVGVDGKDVDGKETKEKHSGHELVEQLRLQMDPKNKLKVLEKVYAKAEWETMQDEKRRMEQHEIEEEQNAMAMIDWYDFVVVETIEFGRDELKKSATAETETQPSVAPVPSEPAKISAQEARKAAAEEEEEDMEVDEAHPKATSKKIQMATDLEQVDRSGRVVAGDEDDELSNIKIRRNYKRQQAAAAPSAQGNVVMDPITGEAIPMEMAQEHLRVQLLNPRWREQKAREQKKLETTNIASADDITTNLMAFASRRAGTKKEEQTQIDDRLIWDGHTASIGQTATAASQLHHLRPQQEQMPAKPTYGPQVPQDTEPASTSTASQEETPPAKRQRTTESQQHE